MADNMSVKRFCQDYLPEIYQKYHITDATVSLLEDEGYTSLRLLRNIEAAGPGAVNDIPDLKGAQKMAVRAMLKSLTADDGDNSSLEPIQTEETTDVFPVIIEGLFPGEIMTIHVSEDETIQDVKNKIQLNLKLSEAIDDIQLHYHNQIMKSGTLSDYNVRRKATLWISTIPRLTADQPAVKKTVKRRYNKKLVITNFTVSVQHMTGKMLLIPVSYSETVDCVKLKICERLGEPRLHPSMLRIIYAGRQLEDGRTLRDYNINSDSVLQVTERVMGD